MDVLEQWTVKGPADHTPARRPGSVRRTSSIDMRWVDGWGSQMRLHGRARDLLTPPDGAAAIVLAEQVMDVGAALDRTIEDITVTPARPGVAGLVGARAGNKLRGMLADAVPDELRDGTPLYLLLDDLAGATLVGGFAFSQWPDKSSPFELSLRHKPSTPRRRMEGICTGFQPGASSLNPDGSSRFTHDTRRVALLPDAADPDAWHRLDEVEEVSMRRARRIDVHVDGGVIWVDSMFQDSAKTPDGGRVAVHEYRLEASADLATGELLTVHADPRVLPYRECPLAAANVHWLLGTPLPELRAVVLERLKGIAGCTHLNDALRALAEVPVLVRPLVETA